MISEDAEHSSEPEVYNDTETTKSERISLHMIARRHLKKEITSSYSQEEILDELNKITHLRLDRESIQNIDHLELLGGSVTNVYLQHNRIEVIENLEYLSNVSFLTLSNNRIERIENLLPLRKLKFLDLSENLINSFDIDEIPQTVIILNLGGNPCTNKADYRGRIIQDLPKLQQLDGEDVTKVEKMEAGFVVSDSEEDEEESGSSEEEEGETRTQNFFSTTMDGLMKRSQKRIQAAIKEHSRKDRILTDLREDLPPDTARSLQGIRDSRLGLAK
ncbi:leucine-rich repeat-containing protein 46-like [Lineus longissimus]|uniref:leucine-rich repeat-containing protein 46-like n=1 Tax=Lineus longissimus TaxID=88925 RepID=UPI002B4E826F